MNVFVLDLSPTTAAIEQCDKHIVKMPLESAQMLCAALHRHKADAPYKPTHKNHPCTLWAGDSRSNFLWLGYHGLALCLEYSRRYHRRHKCQDIIEFCLSASDSIPENNGRTTFPLCMPDKYKTDDPVESYRAYYLGEKSLFAQWNHSNPPQWWPTLEKSNA